MPSLKPSVLMVRLINPFKVHSWAEDECGEETSTLVVGSTVNSGKFSIYFLAYLQ